MGSLHIALRPESNCLCSHICDGKSLGANEWMVTAFPYLWKGKKWRIWDPFACLMDIWITGTSTSDFSGARMPPKRFWGREMLLLKFVMPYASWEDECYYCLRWQRHSATVTAVLTKVQRNCPVTAAQYVAQAAKPTRRTELRAL